MNESLTTLFVRDLETLRKEVSLYNDEAVFWLIENQIKNSGGNLSLHLVGNLQHFIGTVLGGTDYVRNRPEEFGDKDVPREKINKEIDQTISMIEKVIPTLDAERMKEHYPIEVFGSEMSTEYVLFHLLGHLNYHLGQINYHRRLLSQENDG